ncbi:MAG: NADPH-dependent stearoyl-CoA 9-desaturase, partial [Mycobacterium sp.]|nr:NADPH-dependent stearoyl-CoA 9-desaturase [Mycobacterium sp.]
PETRSERMFAELEPGFAGTDLATGRRRGLNTAIATVRKWRRDQRRSRDLLTSNLRNRRLRYNWLPEPARHARPTLDGEQFT